MRKRSFACVLVLAMLSTCTIPALAEETQTVEEAGSKTVAVTEFDNKDVVLDEILVVMEEKRSSKSVEREVEKSLEDGSADCIEKVVADGNTTALVSVDSDADMKECISQVAENEKVLTVQPNFKYKREGITNDPYNQNTPQNQFYLNQIQAEQAWEYAEELPISIEKTKVAVIDGGVDLGQEDLQEALVKEESVYINSAGERLSLTGKGDEHATHVSGIIAATSNNKKGIAGVAAGTKNEFVSLVGINASVTMSDELEDSYFTTFTLMSSIQYAIEKNCRIVNMSLGGAGNDFLLDSCMEDAYENHGVICVCAAGNEGTDTPVSPGDSPYAVSVINVTKQNVPYSGGLGDASNFGVEKDISAPGTSIKSTLPGNQYGYGSGTSMAAPMVTGVFAMMYGVNPDLTPDQARNILYATAKDLGAEGFDEKTGYGLVDAKQAVQKAYEAKTEGAHEAETISLKDDLYEVKLQGTYVMEHLMKPAATLEQATWESSNPEIATVDQKGKVTGITSGVTKITASLANGYQTSGYVHVGKAPAPESLEITNILKQMYEGEMGEIQVRVLPYNTCDNTVSFESDAPAVVSVEEDGSIYAGKTGKATITVKTYNGLEQKQEIMVGPKAKGVTFASKATKLRVGSRFSFAAQVQPKEANEFDVVSYESSNQTIATVDDKGMVTAKRPGQTSIIAGTDSGRIIRTRVVVYQTSYKKGAYQLEIRPQTYDSLVLRWEKIENADGYEIEQKVAGTYKKIAEVSGKKAKYVSRGLKFQKNYRYRIRAYYTDGTRQYCGYSGTVKAKVTLPETKTKLARKSGKNILSWKKVKKADGYIIYRKEGKNGTYKKRMVLGSSNSLQFIDYRVTKGTLYSYKVKAYCTAASGQITAKASNVVSGKAK